MKQHEAMRTYWAIAELFGVVRLAAMLPIKNGEDGEIEAAKAKVQNERARRQSAWENPIP